MGRYVRLAAAAEIPEGEGREFAIEGRIVAVFRVNGEFHAIDGICPHAGGPLGEGRLQGAIVTCPWHGWQFDVTSGTHCLNSRLCQRVYSLERDGDDLLIDLDGSSL